MTPAGPERQQSKPPWRAGFNPATHYARFTSARRSTQFLAILVGIAAVAVLALLAYLLIVEAFRIGLPLGIVVTIGVAFGLLGLYLVIGGAIETIYQRKLSRLAVSRKDDEIKPSDQPEP
jgi:hypothetical protein